MMALVLNCPDGSVPSGLDKDGNVETCIYVEGSRYPETHRDSDLAMQSFSMVFLLLAFAFILGLILWFGEK